MDKEQTRIIKRFSLAVKKEFPDAKIYLFGSRARGDALKNSDFDFLIVSESFKNVKFPRRLEQVHALWDEKYDADLIPYTNEELEKQKKLLTIANKAMSEAVIV